MKKLLLVACFAFAGCASYASNIPEPEQAFSALNSRFAGGPVEDVVNRYGPPDGRSTYRGMTLLLWETARTAQYRVPTSTTTTGTIGDPLWAQVPFRETTSGTTTMSENYACMMRVGVREDGTVDGIDLVGKMGACVNFMP